MLPFQIVIYRMSKHHSLNGYESKGHVGSIPFHSNTKYTQIYCSGSRRIHNQIWQCSNSKYYSFAITYSVVYDDLFCPYNEMEQVLFFAYLKKFEPNLVWTSNYDATCFHDNGFDIC